MLESSFLEQKFQIRHFRKFTNFCGRKLFFPPEKAIVLVVTLAALILFIMQLSSLPGFDEKEIQNSFEVQVIEAVRNKNNRKCHFEHFLVRSF